MSTDPSAAIGRIDAAVEESAQPPGAPTRELADLAAAIGRIESLIAGGATPSPHGTAAEPIADTAFVLHERELETSLCDTLDAAVREINDGGVLKDGSTERRQQLAELLRQLSRRVHDMIAQSQANQRSEPAADVGTARTSTKLRHPLLDEGDGEEDVTDAGFKTDVPEDDEFALVVAALTASLPSLAEFGAPVPIPPGALAENGPTIETMLPQLESSEDAILVGDSASAVLPQSRSPEGAQGENLTASEPPLALGEDFVRDLMSSENPAVEPSADVVLSADAPAEESALDTLLALPGPKTSVDSTNEDSAEPSGVLPDREIELAHDADEQHPPAVSGSAPVEDGSRVTLSAPVAPEDDPGDLFESTMPELGIAPAPDRSGPPTAEKVPEPESPIETALSVSAALEPEAQTAPLTPSPQPRTSATAPVQPPRPASNDPLAPIRALSEEEMIALFS
jgi:hypothetical protein